MVSQVSKLHFCTACEQVSQVALPGRRFQSEEIQISPGNGGGDYHSLKVSQSRVETSRTRHYRITTMVMLLLMMMKATTTTMTMMMMVRMMMVVVMVMMVMVMMI